jgi:orotate phosphoribosyltransferase
MGVSFLRAENQYLLNSMVYWAFVTPQAESILELFRSTGAYLEGHFRLTSGLHSSQYLQCALVLQHPAAAEKLGRLLAAQIRATAGGGRIDLVASPALGGLIIGHETAKALGVRFVFTERDATTGKMTFRRGFSIEPGENAVVVEDVITTGGSTVDVVEALRALGANPLAAGSIIDRSGGHASVGVPRAALATLQVAAHYPEQCPLCASGIPVVKPGSRLA